MRSSGGARCDGPRRERARPRSGPSTRSWYRRARCGLTRPPRDRGPRSPARASGRAGDVSEGPAVTVEEVIDRIDAWRGRATAIRPLTNGLTNANYRVDVDGRAYVVRI